MKVKITVNSEDRIVMIPMEFDPENDTLSFDEIQIEPVPANDEDISRDIVMNLAGMIISTLQGNNN